MPLTASFITCSELLARFLLPTLLSSASWPNNPAGNRAQENEKDPTTAPDQYADEVGTQTGLLIQGTKLCVYTISM